MRGALIFLSTVILSLAAGLGGYSLYHKWSSPGDPAASSEARSDTRVDSKLIGSRRSDFTLNDLEGQPRAISEWDGQVLLINFWATWCPPCRREIPLLASLHREYSGNGFAVLGVALDNLDKVKSYVREFDVPYPNLAGQYEVAEVAAKLGNAAGSLPYSVLLDRQGNIRYVHLGEISHDQALKQIQPLLAQE